MPIVPILSQKEQSLIKRLPAGRRDEYLKKLSANARGPGGRPSRSAAGWDNGSPAHAAWAKHAAHLGVVAIEARGGTLTVELHASPPLGQRADMVIDVPTGTPATQTFTDETRKSSTFAGAGLKTAAVTSAMQAAGYEGKAEFTV